MDDPIGDWPAAHSMDTAWFAVDVDGHVGRFDTGEDGALPNAAAHEGGPMNPNFPVERLYAALGAVDSEQEEAPGLFQYSRDHGDDPGRYQRQTAPEPPIRLETLEPELQEALGAFRLPVRFDEAEVVHLADHLSDEQASTWNGGPLRWPEGGPPSDGPAQPPPARGRPGRWGLLLLALLGAAVLWWWLFP